MAALGQHCPFCTALVWVANDGTMHQTEEAAVQWEKEHPRYTDGEQVMREFVDDFEHEHPDERERRYSEYE